MPRQRLLALLDRHVARFPADAAMAGRIAALVTEHDDCFERTCGPGHITASAWIVSADHQRCLLTHHRKLGRWLQLGGHADGVTDPLEVALTEAREESGMAAFAAFGEPEPLTLDLDVHTIPARASEPEHEHHDIRYLLIAAADQPVVVSEESHDVRWFGWDEVRAHVDEPSMLRMLERARDWLGV